MATQTTVEVKVRYRSQTYIASAPRGLLKASSTAGPEQAARALSHKLFTGAAAKVALLRKEGDCEVWGITAITRHRIQG